MDTPRLQNKLIAAASLIGFDAAIAIIQAERRPFLRIVDDFKASCDRIVGGHVDESHKQMLPSTHDQMRAQVREKTGGNWPRAGLRDIATAVRAIGAAPAPKRKYNKRSTYWGKGRSAVSKTAAKKAHDKVVDAIISKKTAKILPVSKFAVIAGIEGILKDGARPIGEILDRLENGNFVRNTGTKTRMEIVTLISGCPKFARGAAGNSYKLRTNPVRAVA